MHDLFLPRVQLALVSTTEKTATTSAMEQRETIAATLAPTLRKMTRIPISHCLPTVMVLAMGQRLLTPVVTAPGERLGKRRITGKTHVVSILD